MDVIQNCLVAATQTDESSPTVIPLNEKRQMAIDNIEQERQRRKKRRIDTMYDETDLVLIENYNPAIGEW